MWRETAKASAQPNATVVIEYFDLSDWKKAKKGWVDETWNTLMTVFQDEQPAERFLISASVSGDAPLVGVQEKLRQEREALVRSLQTLRGSKRSGAIASW